MPELRVLREADLKAVLDVETGLEIVERTFRDLGTRDIFRLSEPAALFGGSGIATAARYKSKGATLISENVTGIRLISDVARKHGFRSHHMLVVFDDGTGAPIGLLNETWLHRFRTALTGVVAARASGAAGIQGACADRRRARSPRSCFRRSPGFSTSTRSGSWRGGGRAPRISAAGVPIHPPGSSPWTIRARRSTAPRSRSH